MNKRHNQSILLCRWLGQLAFVALVLTGCGGGTGANNGADPSVTPTPIPPPPGISLLTGSIGGPGHLDAQGGAARFAYPAHVAVDTHGNVYVAQDAVIRRIAPNGQVSTLAGGAGWGFADGAGTAARFFRLGGLAVDAAGHVYVADTGNHAIRKVSPRGDVTTLAGTPGVTGKADGIGGAASFFSPEGVAVDAVGHVYVADTGNGTIRKIAPGGDVTTLAGTAWTRGAVDGLGAAARFTNPAGLAVDSQGNVYVAERARWFANDIFGTTHIEYANTIRKVSPSGMVTTLAGANGTHGAIDGVGTAARFGNPTSVAVDAAGNVYVADKQNRTLRMIDPTGRVTTLAGLAGSGGTTDGRGTAARFLAPTGVAVDALGQVYVADSDAHTVRRVFASGLVSTFAGAAREYGSTDGLGAAARFGIDTASDVYREESPNPGSVAVDQHGNTYVADVSNHTIRKITAAGAVTTLAGAAGVPGSADGRGAAAQFNFPSGVAVNSLGQVFVADTGDGTVRKITPAGFVSTLAGAAGVYPTGSSVDGVGSAARFHYPHAVAVDNAGNVFVTDSQDNLVRKITAGGAVSTFAGSGAAQTIDGVGRVAALNQPGGITIDSAGNLYVAEWSGSHDPQDYPIGRRHHPHRHARRAW